MSGRGASRPSGTALPDLPRTSRVLLVRSGEDASDSSPCTCRRPEAWPEVAGQEDWPGHFAEDLGPRLASVLPAVLRALIAVLREIARPDPGRDRRRYMAVTDLSAIALVRWTTSTASRALPPPGGGGLGPRGEELAAHEARRGAGPSEGRQGAPRRRPLRAPSAIALSAGLLDRHGAARRDQGRQGELEGGRISGSGRRAPCRPTPARAGHGLVR